MTYKDQLKQPQWQQVRLKIFERDGWKCTKCSASDKQLHVHHTYYIHGAKAWDYPQTMLRTLCNQCHEDTHGITKAAEQISEFKMVLYGAHERFDYLRDLDIQIDNILLNLRNSQSDEIKIGVQILLDKVKERKQLTAEL
jgi:hypothetical protein